MPEGGFLLKFDGKEIKRCHCVAFDYDSWECTINNTKKMRMPNIKTITIEVEEERQES